MVIAYQVVGLASTTPRFHRPPLKRGRVVVVVVGQVAHFNLTSEASSCRGFYFLPFMLLGSMDNAPPSKEGGKVAVVVVGQVARFNLTPEASLCRGLHWLPFALSGSTEEPDLHTIIRSFSLCSQEAS